MESQRGAAQQPNIVITQAPKIPIDETTETTNRLIAEKKKKKRKSRGKANKPTGFEEYYADAPLTPTEYQEEIKDLYHPSRSFAERIELCIQRYRAKRRFDAERKNVFDKYLAMGGVDTGPKMFSGGMHPRDLDDMDNEQIAALAATDSVNVHKLSGGRDSMEWVVDFEGIAKAFFSTPHSGPGLDFATESSVDRAVSVVRNFLNYVLHHNVCPEYADQVLAARSVCDKAQQELQDLIVLGQLVPGQFNMACSTLYGGYYKGLYVGDQAWAKELNIDVGMSDARAQQIIAHAISTMGNRRGPSTSQDTHAIANETLYIEVTEIILCPPSSQETSTEQDDSCLEPVGVMKAVAWDSPFDSFEDISEDSASEDQGGDEEPRSKADTQAYEFWLERDILECCFVGMKMRATVRRLPGGFCYFDSVTALLCSFFYQLASEQLSAWKTPQAVDPSEDDNDADANGDNADGYDGAKRRNGSLLGEEGQEGEEEFVDDHIGGDENLEVV